MHALTHPRSAISLSLTVGVALAVIVPVVLAEPWWREFGVALTLAGAGPAAVVDAETGRIPDRLVLLAAVPTAVVVAIDLTLHSGAGALAGPAAGMLAFAGPLLAVHLVSPAAMGFGDVKLAAVLGAALGTIDPRAALLALCIAAAVAAATGIARRRSAVPLGPGLVAGSALAVVATAPVLEAVATWR